VGFFTLFDSGNGVGADNKLPLNASGQWNGGAADDQVVD
jgi:hypothetical protein